MHNSVNKEEKPIASQLDEKNKNLVDFFALLFSIDRRSQKSKETVCNTLLAKSK